MPPPPGPVVEIREPGRPVRRLTVHGSVEVGRDCAGVLVSDPEVSRRHLRLTARAGRLSILDLGSTNGTTVNGVPLAGEGLLRTGDRVRLGDTEILALEPAARPTAGQPADEPPTATAPAPPAAQPRPVLEELAARTTDAGMIRYRPGTAGEAAAAGYASAVRRARRRLAGLGSEPWGVRPQICLVDPFPDPEDPRQVVASGTLVDAARGEIWVVVTPESPPEPPERPLALFFGAALPAGHEIEVLVEGYGLHLAGLPPAEDYLRDLALPPIARADGELRATDGPVVRALPDRAKWRRGPAAAAGHRSPGWVGGGRAAGVRRRAERVGGGLAARDRHPRARP